MSNEFKHTPLPWIANGRYIGTPNHMSYVGEVRDQNGNWSDTEKSRGDAAFIVKACNSHYDLLTALQRLVTMNDDYGHFGGEIYQDKIDQAWQSARDALAKARGE